ncbi:MAG: 3-hydroxyacyl-CoA dehydrogenase family protein [Solirubrobacterales bacterium]|nr:3-hydroxyacyl-CoA dehydrogenase family protein [Solirubrobacterales bacterium]
MFVFKAAVVGAGTMGGEIAQVIASAEIPVVLKDIDQELVDQGLQKARSLWQGQVDQGKLEPAELERKLALITGATGYEALGDVEFVIEAVPEQMELKQTVFSELDQATPGHAILASNTSSLPITEVAQVTSRPDKVVGFHFFYPASVMRLIEVIEGEDTSPETLQAATNFAMTIRKSPIRCGEAPGFVVNRILNSALSEVWRFQADTGAEFNEIDEAMTESNVAPMGPFYLCDLVGLDTVLRVAEQLQDAYGDRYYVHEQLRELTAQGNLGAKTGKGFYEHK